ncbi:hypothetical protein CONLIGDRAFT_574027 [Coniochaeta ligniaria NRRL 30616]|uniref:Rho1 guanine nucleotide exchange factor 3 n=1 Tax=Coniochaeta ligniaria NRRL 30616 TaxID=1408157 RepID=A0A1J7JU33_9PEZI|nr:hypothetical protein CONLIGDRAFT_574027 [Coniochaeta ligniaria NRRL 30616]
MSFRGDDSRRYGHVPPAQYAVPNPAPLSPDQQNYPPRRPSFSNGDEGSFFDPSSTRPQDSYPAGAGRGSDELFIGGNAQQSRQSYAPPNNSAIAGYQHQYTQPAAATHQAYNPQHFARSQSTSLPYHPHPAARYASPASPTYAPAPPAPPTPTAPNAYAPLQTYNPAAYASTASPTLPQRNATVAGYNSYGYGSYSSPAVPQTSSFQQTPTPSTYGSPQLAQGQTPPTQQGYSPVPPSPGYAPQTASSSASSYHDPQYSASSGYSGQQYFPSYSTNGPSPAGSSAYAQAPYPGYTQIPVGPNYSTSDPNSFMSRTSRSNSQEPLPSPPAHYQPTTGLARHPTNAPLPNRPMENVPEERWDANGQQMQDRDAQEQLTQDSLINDIVSDLGVPPHSQRPRPTNGNVFGDDAGREEDGKVSRYNSTASTAASNQNFHGSPYEWDDDESDPEAVAGLMAMQADAMDDRRFSSIPTFGYVDQPPTTTSLPTPSEEQSTDSGEFMMDLGLAGGGYAGNLAYGNDALPSPPAPGSNQDAERPLPYPQDSSGGFPQYSEASMDYGGTGGLQMPQTHRLSFDEGDERVSMHSRQSGSESPVKEDYPDMFYHPGLSNRPLPAIPPPASDSSSMLSVQPSRAPYQHGYSLSADSRTPEVYHGQNMNQQQVERSISLSSHSHTPQVVAPSRSITDAAEARRKQTRHMNQQQQFAAQNGLPYDGYDSGTPSSLAAYDAITLPSGRKKKFIPSKLSSTDMKRCAEPWALSGIAAWVREMAEGDPETKRKTIEEGLVRLFCFKVPTMNVADAEVLSAGVVDAMFEANILIPEEEWVKFGQGSMSGVLWQLTGSGCYAPKLHEHEEQAPRLHDNGTPVRCYSYHCGRTLKKANLDNMMSEEDIKVLDWSTFYGISAEEREGKSKKEIEKQNILHEIVTGEEEYMNQLDVVRLLYRDQLRNWQPPIIAANRLESFLAKVFTKVEELQRVNKEHLLAQLKYRQKEQGPYIVGFSDLFREWIRKARTVYIEYCSNFPYASYLIRKEAERNLLFRQFLDVVREHKRSKRLEWTTFLKAPITRLQRYSLLLATVHKNMVGESEEKANLARALDEIKAVTHEIDNKVNDTQQKIKLLELQSMLVLRPGFQSVLNLEHLGRKLIFSGELQRQGSKGVRWLDTHAMLFDHYFILAKPVKNDGRGGTKYDVSKEPIPMPLLFLESMNDDPVSKQKGITAPLARTTAATGSTTQLNKVATNGSGRPGLEHTPTGSSMSSMTTTLTGDPDSKIIYPFRIKHLGHEVYTLYASTPKDREDWCRNIIDAKTAHANALHDQNAEPFRLRVLSDGAFAYDSVTAQGRQLGVSISGTPLHRAIREMELIYGPGRGPPPVCRAQVNCATAFNAYGKSLIAIGTDYGLYISEASNPRGWTRSVQINKVTQIAVLEEFSICLIIADKSLIAYPLDVVAPVSNFPAPSQDNPRRAPQRLAKDVAFFATARMKDRMLLFYKRKEGMHNTFKVLEPVFQKATERKTRLFGGRRSGAGGTESFRDYDEFYLPTECYSLNLFQTYIAVASAKGFELLTLDKKIPQSIPRDLNVAAIANIASRIRDQRPLGMFKLNDQEFLLTYEDCAVYVDKHGEISRTLIMEYSGKQKKAKGATMFGQYLLLFNEDYVEVRNAENGRLRQIIAGRDVRCLDYGFRGPTGGSSGVGVPTQPVAGDSKGTVKICMSHPEVAGGQIVLEMLLNDGHREELGKIG